jgi:hypothetical protein
MMSLQPQQTQQDKGGNNATMVATTQKTLMIAGMQRL